MNRLLGSQGKIRVEFIIIIIIIIIITFMQGDYNYIPETNRVSRVCSIAALTYLQILVH